MRYVVTLFLAFWASTSVMPAQNQANSRPSVGITVKEFSAEAFLYTRSSGSIVVSGTCRTTPIGETVETDTIRASEPSSSKKIDETFDDLSKASRHVTWSRSSDGLLHVKDDRAMATILTLVVKRIEINDAVSVRDALQQVLSSPELKAFTSKNHIVPLPIDLSYTVSMNDEVDHLKGRTDAHKYTHMYSDVTLEEVLNSIVRAFPGVWIYSECPGGISIIADPTGRP